VDITQTEYEGVRGSQMV